jgi:hypothetical protein
MGFRWPNLPISRLPQNLSRRLPPLNGFGRVDATPTTLRPLE